MKAYTDISQSKVLAGILPIESADMCYKCIGEDPYDVCLRPYSEWREEYKGLLVAKEVDVFPCWSLAALLDVLPKGYSLGNKKSNDKYNICMTFVEHNVIEYDNPVDVCYEMIIKLHELNLL